MYSLALKLKSLKTINLVVVILFIVVFLGVIISNARGAEYPEKPIDIIVPFPPGGATDLIPRAYAPSLSKKWGVAVNVINKPGGGAIVGTLEVVRATPDGYTMMSDVTGASSVQAAMYENLPYKLEERTYIARLVTFVNAIIVPASRPWKTLDDVAQAIRENPTDFIFGATGGASGPDIIMGQLRAELEKRGIDLSRTKTVSYQGAPVVSACGGGHIDIIGGSRGFVGPMVDAGKVRIIAVTGPCEEIPDVTTTEDQGYPLINYKLWVGVSGPPGLSNAIVQTWINSLKEVMNEPKIVEKVKMMGGRIELLLGDSFREFVMDESNRIKNAREKGKIKAKVYGK